MKKKPKILSVIIIVVTIFASLFAISSGMIDIFEFTDKKVTNLSGAWIIKNQIDKTFYNPYRGLSISYKIFLAQEGKKITGVGEKIRENGESINNSIRSQISLTGTINGNQIIATFEEKGLRRNTTGQFNWTIQQSGKVLSGKFIHTAANSSGRSTAKKINSQ